MQFSAVLKYVELLTHLLKTSFLPIQIAGTNFQSIWHLKAWNQIWGDLMVGSPSSNYIKVTSKELHNVLASLPSSREMWGFSNKASLNPPLGCNKGYRLSVNNSEKLYQKERKQYCIYWTYNQQHALMKFAVS